MKLLFKVIFLIIAVGECSGQKNVYKEKVDRAIAIENMPYIPDLSGDDLFWNIMTDKEILPYLIERISDTTTTKAPVRYFGSNYRIGDVCTTAIGQLIPAFRAVDLIETDQRVIDEKGYGVYWEYVRNYEKRKEFQRRVRSWYRTIKGKLQWVKDDKFYPTEDTENSPMRKLPAGGIYSIKTK